jgi:hypothetical protein
MEKQGSKLMLQPVGPLKTLAQELLFGKPKKTVYVFVEGYLRGVEFFLLSEAS